MHRFKPLLIALASLGAYTSAWACTCIPLTAGPDDVSLDVEVGGARGCGRMVPRKVEVVAVVQDPRGDYEVGDTTTMRFNQGPDASCGLDVHTGDRLVVIAPADADPITVGLCNSFSPF